MAGLSAREEEVARLRALLEQAADGIFLADVDGRFTDVNEAGCLLVGFTRDELLRMAVGDLLASDESARLSGARALLLTGATHVAEWRLRHKEGHFIPVEMSAKIAVDGCWQSIVRDITGRKRVEDEQRQRLESEQRYRATLDNSMDAVFLTMPDGRIAMANAAAVALFGYSEAELCRLGRAAVVDESDPRLHVALAERAATGRFRGEITLKRKDGSRFPAEISSAIFRDEGGVQWTSMFVRDLTERNRLAAEVDERHRWLEAVVANVPAGVIMYAPDGTVAVNQRAEELLGMHVSPAGGSRQYANRILYPDGTVVPPASLPTSRVLARGETVIGEEFLVERSDGVRIPILGSAAPILAADGRVLGCIGISQDVSDWMRAEERIRASERLFSTLFEISPVGLFVADREGRFLRANEMGRRIWAGERVGVTDFAQFDARWADSGHPVSRFEWPLTRALAGEKSIGSVLRVRAFDGSQRVIVSSALPLYDERHRVSGALVVHDDITELSTAEQALRRAVQARDDVLGIVAHDLRNPLHGILLQADLLGSIGDGHAREIAAALRRRALRMNRLVEDLLDVAQIEGGSLRIGRAPVDVRALVADIEETHRALAADAGIELAIDPVAPLVVMGDRDRLAQVLENLVGNALKFTSTNGRIRLGAVAAGDSVRFSVADDGAGIAEEHLPRLFDRFWQASNTAKRGAGLGLAIAKGIVEAHGGRIWAESRVGDGTVFQFEIPRARACVDEPVEPHPQTPA